MKKLVFFKRIQLILTVLFFLFSALVVSSCEKQAGRFQRTQISIYLINEEGKKTTHFKQGEIPIVVLEVVNAGKEKLKLYPRLHNREYILLYNNDKQNSEIIGNFYSDGQLTNDDPPTIYSSETITRIQLPWIWTEKIIGEIIEYTLDGNERTRNITSNSFDPGDNNFLTIGNYKVKLSIPSEWDIPVDKSEIIFRVD